MAQQYRERSISKVTDFTPNSPLFVRAKSYAHREDLVSNIETDISLDDVEVIPDSNSNSAQSHNQVPRRPDSEFEPSTSLSVMTEKPYFRGKQHPSQTGPAYLHTYINCMYFLGICPIQHTEGDACGKAIYAISKVAFWSFSTIAVVHALKLAKYFTMNFLTEGDLVQYVTLAFFLIRCISKVYFVKVLASNVKQILKMLQSISSSNNCRCKQYKGFTSKAAVILAMGSWTASLLSSVFGGPSIRHWSLQESIREHSYDLAHGLFVWDTGNATEQFVRDEYFEELSQKTIVLGMTEYLIRFCGNLQDHAFGDLLLMGAITLCELTNDLNNKISDTPPSTDDSGSINSIWDGYKYVKFASKSINECIGGLLIFLHFNNVLLFGYTLLRLHKRGGSVVVLIFTTVFKILKSTYMYYVATKAAKTNEVLRTWVHERCLSKHVKEIQVNGIPVQVGVLLDELKMNHIGLGEGAFRIDIEFILKLATLVASYFMFLATES